MKAKYRTLGGPARNLARKVAVKMYIDNGEFEGCASIHERQLNKMAKTAAKSAAKEADLGTGIIASIFVAVIARLIVSLIMHWIDSQLAGCELGESFMEGEPGHG